MLHRNTKSTNDSYRMLVTDLDGTLLTEDKQVLDIDREAVSALRELGVHVTIATGRLYSGVEPVAETIEVEDIVACLNGSEMVDTRDGSSLLRRILPLEERRTIRQRLRSSTIETVLFASRTIYHGTSSTGLVDRFSSWSEKFDDVGDVFDSAVWDAEDDVLAVVGIGPRDEVLGIGEELRSHVGEEREVLSVPSPRSDSGFLMVRDNRQDKGIALRQLAKRRDLTENQVVCVGDWVNDIPMLESGALSFAMGGTDPWLQGSANHVLETHREKGGAIAEIARRVWDVDI
jgi:Cof subfamily protein (haloacid dehalogenase superfamily)